MFDLRLRPFRSLEYFESIGLYLLNYLEHFVFFYCSSNCLFVHRSLLVSTAVCKFLNRH